MIVRVHSPHHGCTATLSVYTEIPRPTATDHHFLYVRETRHTETLVVPTVDRSIVDPYAMSIFKKVRLNRLPTHSRPLTWKLAVRIPPGLTTIFEQVPLPSLVTPCHAPLMSCQACPSITPTQRETLYRSMVHYQHQRQSSGGLAAVLTTPACRTISLCHLGIRDICVPLIFSFQISFLHGLHLLARPTSKAFLNLHMLDLI